MNDYLIQYEITMMIVIYDDFIMLAMQQLKLFESWFCHGNCGVAAKLDFSATTHD